MDHKRFLADCWKIVLTLGEENEVEAKRARSGWGLKETGALVYKDRSVLIVAERPPSKRILVERVKGHNPVCCTNTDGAPFRWHGEYTRILAHVRVLAVNLANEERSAIPHPPKLG